MGLELISANNGWAMAITGAIIVILGLSTLAAIISQLHKIIDLLEKKEPPRPVAKPADRPSAPAEIDLFEDPAATAQVIKGISADLGSPFELADLYQRLRKDQIPHPHLTIRSLRDAGFLVPTGHGTFAWQQST